MFGNFCLVILRHLSYNSSACKYVCEQCTGLYLWLNFIVTYQFVKYRLVLTNLCILKRLFRQVYVILGERYFNS